MTDSPRTLPLHWLWRACWLTLIAVLAISISAAIALGSGLADPPRAGPLLWQMAAQPKWLMTANGGTVTFQRVPFEIPAPPFTLEVVARYSEGDPGAFWLLTFETNLNAPPSSITKPRAFHKLDFVVYNNGYFAVRNDFALQRVEFPHLNRAGAFNKLALDVAADQTVVLRLNDEIAWHGKINVDLPWSLFLEASPGNLTTQSLLTWKQIAMYAPKSP